MGKYTNILKITDYTDYYREFMLRLMKVAEPDIPIEENHPEVNNHVQHVSDEILVVRKINEILPTDSKFILNVNLLEIYPKEIKDIILGFCENCNSK